MPKKKKLVGVLLALILISGGWARASEKNMAIQTVAMRVPEICILNLNGNERKLNVNLADSSGESSQSENKNIIYIQYSCIVGRNKYRTLTVKIESSDLLPSGCSLKLQALPSGKKNEGMSTGQIILSVIPQALITGIGSCATGTDATDGALLIYSFSVDHRANLIPSAIKPVVIIMTFAESY
jgi:hypothetical protein